MIKIEESRYSINQLKKGKWEELATECLDNKNEVKIPTSPNASRLTIQIPESRALKKTINLPYNARHTVRQILNFEMDRYTPFKSKDVYFSYNIHTDHGNKETIQVILTLSKKSYIDSLNHKFSTLGIHNILITADDVSKEMNLANITPIYVNQHSLSTLNIAKIILLITAIVLAILNLTSVTHKKEQLKNTIIEEINSLKLEATQAKDAQKQIDSLISAIEFPTKLSNEYQSLLKIMNDLSHLISDDTWLQSLEYHHPEIRIDGESEEPGDVLTSLAKAPIFKNVKFNAPISSGNIDGKRRFSVRMELSNSNEPN